MADCAPCRSGHHLPDDTVVPRTKQARENSGGCQHGTCRCSLCGSLRNAVHFRPRLANGHLSEPEVGAALATLWQSGALVRFKLEAGLPVMLFRPSLRQLSRAVLEVVRPQLVPLAGVLVPEGGRKGMTRPWWSWAALSSCTCCGYGTVLRDPLGECRHAHCGWLGQRPALD